MSKPDPKKNKKLSKEELKKINAGTGSTQAKTSQNVTQSSKATKR